MSVSLLDVNVLLALAWPTHVHHLAAHRWFAENSGLGWATCPLTQLDLAIRHQGRLATFDRRVLGLLPPDSVPRDAVAIIPT